MKSISKKLSMVFTLLPVLSVAATSAADEAIRILAISDGKTVQVASGKEMRQVGAGTDVHRGETVTTGPKQTARIGYPNGSELWIGKDAEVTVDQGKFVSDAEIQRGQARIKVPKAIKAKLPREIIFPFRVRTRVITMGVRGTDFVVKADPTVNSTQLNTLEGTVAAAQDSKGLLDDMNQDKVDVTSGQFIRAEKDHPIPQPKPFNRSAFQEELLKEQPGFLDYEAQQAKASAESEKAAAPAAQGSSNFFVNKAKQGASGALNKDGARTGGSVPSGD